MSISHRASCCLAMQLPDSVGVELESSRQALEAVLGQGTIESLSERLVELRELGADAGLLRSIIRRLAFLAPRLAVPGGMEAWLTAVSEVTQRAKYCTNALLESSEEVLRHGSPYELLLWARLGLRHGHVLASAGEDATLAHFELRSRSSALVVSENGGTINLESSKARLTHLLRVLFDISPTLLPVEEGLESRRTFLSNFGLHLPEANRALRGSLARQWFDAAAAHAAAHMVYSTHKFERGSLKPIQTALLGVLEDARVELLAMKELPGLRHLWLKFHVVEPEHGLSFTVLLLRLARGLLDPTYEDPSPWVIKAVKLFHEASEGGRALQKLEPALLRDMASRLGNDIGQMRLQFNYRDYVVEPSYRDDNAHLWIDEEEKVKTVSTADPLPPPPDDAEVQPVSPLEDLQSLTIARYKYPEWDRLVDDYRTAWCTVQEGRPIEGDSTVLRSIVNSQSSLMQRLRRVLRSGLMREKAKLRAQPRGDELDIDATVRAHIDRRLKHSPSDKVYQRQGRRERDVAALMLIDASVSTAGPVASGDSVLDLARGSALLTALTLSDAGDSCAIDTFCSNGRHEVSYDISVDFGEALDDAAVARLVSVRSRWSTRMGAALRHATMRLTAQHRRRSLLLFITDGEPYDIDIYDRRYLIEDTKRAVIEARRRGVTVFCVTLDPAADKYVRTVFGSGNYRILDRIENLPRVLPAVVLQLTR